MLGLRTANVSRFVNGTVLERPAREGESPVHESNRQRQDPEYHETRGTLWEVGGTTPKAKYSLVTDRAKYCEGTVKRTPGGE